MAKYKVEITSLNTKDIEVLTNEEMTYLFQNINEEGNKERLIRGNLKLVLSILKNYNNRVDNLDDLFQVGCIGLIKAIDNFDLSHEVKFSTYAVPMILGEVKRYLRDNSTLRVARSIKDMAYKSLKAKEQLTNKNQKEPTIKEIADYLNVDEVSVVTSLDSLKDTLSMSEPIYSDGGDTIYLEDQIKDDKDMYDLDIKISLYDALNKLIISSLLNTFKLAVFTPQISTL